MTALPLALAAAGCGGNGPPGRWARPQVMKLGWHENCGTGKRPLPIATRRLVVGRRRWQVDLSFRNETGLTLEIVRPHAVGETLFGLEPFETTSRREVLARAQSGGAKPRAFADRFTPSIPVILAPRKGWSGSFSGLGRVPAEVPIRVVLGRFVPTGVVPKGFFDGFLCVSERFVRLQP